MKAETTLLDGVDVTRQAAKDEEATRDVTQGIALQADGEAAG